MANRRSNVVSIAKGLPRVSAGDEKQDEYLPRVFGVSNSLLTAITPKHFDVLDIFTALNGHLCGNGNADPVVSFNLLKQCGR